MHDNDITIFRYLNPTENEILSKINDNDLEELLKYLDRYYLEYRKSLGLANDVTFGIEIEIERFRGGLEEFAIFQDLITSIVGNDRWETKNDISLINDGICYGREISSDILTDCLKTWIDIENVCNASSEWGIIGPKCGGHVHIGAHILGENSLYWYRFIKLCIIYENIIYRFCYGEYLTHRPIITSKAKPSAVLYNTRLPILESKLNGSLFELLTSIDIKHVSSDSLKNYGISFWHMLCDNDYNLYEDYNKINKYCTMEFRAPNGTLDYIIWQNNINFAVKLLSYCKSDKFDDEILNRRYNQVCGMFGNLWSYSKIYLEQALELCDMIFDNNLDKIYFLRQYLKSFEVSEEVFAKAKKYTMTK